MKKLSKKTYIFILFVLTASTSFSQNGPIQVTPTLGINTEEPTRTIDINGDFRLRQLNKEDNQTVYGSVLLVNPLGEVESMPIEKLKNLATDLLSIENKNLYYLDKIPNETKTLTCGSFQFSYGNSLNPEKSVNITMSLLNKPALNTNIYYNLIRKSNDVTKRSYTSNSLSFTSNNYQTPQNLTLDLNLNEFAEIHLAHPQDKSYYKVSFLARKNYEEAGVVYNSYTILCEKY